MRYAEGIDRIGLLLNPLTFNKYNIKNHKDPYNKLTLHRAGQFVVLSIHEEWFNPLFDYQLQIALAIYELAKEGFYNIPDTPFTPLFIYLNWKLFFLSIVAIEFFSDYKRKNIKIDEDMLKPTIDEAKEEGALYRYFDKKNNEYTETYYSPDKKETRKSQFIHYNKLKKSIKDNNKGTIEELTKNQNPERLEFRIYAGNSRWLHWENLKGNYQKIFNRYKEYLATIYNNFIFGCLTTKGKENPNFKQVAKLAEKNNRIKYRNKDRKLKQREVLKDKELFSKKILTDHTVINKSQEINNLFDSFTQKKCNFSKMQKMTQDSEYLEKNRVKNGKNE